MNALDRIRPELADLPAAFEAPTYTDCPLHANELPWTPPNLPNIAVNRYPNAKQVAALQTSLAGYYKVDTSEILITRGSDDGLDLIMRLFLRAGVDSIMQCPPTFSMYAFFARLQQAGIINCPLIEDDDGYRLDLTAMQTLWQDNCKLILLCRPNNPTGELLSLKTIEQICRQFDKSIVVVDEAYIEFADTTSAASLINKLDNLIVLRTLSKAFGMAALRLGGVIAQAPVIAMLKKITAPYPISSTVIDMAVTALDDKDWFTSVQARIAKLRAQLAASLQQSPKIEKIYPAHANFLLIKTPHAGALADWFEQNGINVRAFGDTPTLADKLRISIGTDEQNTKLLQALAAFNGELK